MGDLKCPKCENNTFQVRADGQRAVTFICVACWKELQREDLTREVLDRLNEGVTENVRRRCI
jgi:hypothetical protein